MSAAVILVLSSVGIEHGSRSPAMGVSTYSTTHNVGLMKLMGQNTDYSERHKAFDKVVRTLSGHSHRLG